MPDNTTISLAFILVIFLLVGAVSLEQYVNGMMSLIVDDAIPFVVTLAAIPYFGGALVVIYEFAIN